MAAVVTLSFADLSKWLREADRSGFRPFRLVVLRNIVVEPLETYLRYGAARLGLDLDVQWGDYDTISSEAVGEVSKWISLDTQAVMVFCHLEGASWGLARQFNSLDRTHQAAERARVVDWTETVVRGIRSKTQAMILWQGFLTPAYPAQGIFDSQTSHGQLGAIRQLNDAVRDALRRTPGAYFVDLDLCRGRVGDRHFYDDRYWHMGRAPFSLEAYEEIASENLKFLRAVVGQAKKCLVLDCDNVLWGGVVGEDGLANLKLGASYPGSTYQEFQQVVLDLHQRGVILALCSKNNEADVREVFGRHPDMILQEAHFAAQRVNWNDKVTNLRELAAELNIGLDSMVFVDDSEFEINLVRSQLPEVETIHIPAAMASRAGHRLLSAGLFDTLTVSAEDARRGQMYREEAIRQHQRAAATDLEGYYRSLDMRLEIGFVDDLSLPRVAQQTQKTNQFNLTTRRYTEADIQAFARREDAAVIFARLRDRFGDSGIVGTCILIFAQGEALIDTFLLSCRALGRGVEDAFLSQSLRLAKARGASAVVGEYYATGKNAQVSDFFASRGFEEIGAGDGGADRRFRLDLSRPVPPEPEYFGGIEAPIPLAAPNRA